VYRGVKCKHIYAVEISFSIRKQVEITKIEPIIIQACIFCKLTNIVKDGLRHNKYGDLQKYNCRQCNHYFTINLGNTSNHKIITTTILYWRILARCSKVFETTRCEYQSQYCIQMDKEICKINGTLFGTN